jgi:hypothetical protein
MMDLYCDGILQPVMMCGGDRCSKFRSSVIYLAVLCGAGLMRILLCGSEPPKKHITGQAMYPLKKIIYLLDSQSPCRGEEAFY